MALVKNLSAKRETRVQSLSQEDPLEKEMATHSIILAWTIPWTEEPGGLQSMGSQRVGRDLVTTYRHTHTHILFHILFHYGLSQNIEYSSLCYTVRPVVDSLHLLIPNSQSILTFPPLLPQFRYLYLYQWSSVDVRVGL